MHETREFNQGTVSDRYFFDLVQEEIEKVRKRQAEREAEKAQREEELVRMPCMAMDRVYSPFVDHDSNNYVVPS